MGVGFEHVDVGIVVLDGVLHNKAYPQGFRDNIRLFR